MKRLLEIIVFLGFSAALHAAILIPLPGGSVSGSGDGGEDRATLQAASGEIAALVSRWTAPPEITPVAALVAPVIAEAPPVQPQADRAMALRPPTPLAAQSVPETHPRLPAPVDRPSAPMTEAAALARPIIQDEAPEMPRPDPTEARDIPTAPVAPTVDAPPEREAVQALAQSIRPTTRPENRDEPAEQRLSSQASAQPERRAAGAGGDAVRGDNGSAPAATQSSAEQHSLMASWGAQIIARIERRKPRVAGAGVVTLQLVVARGGQVQSIAIAQSSGNQDIDAAGIRAVQSAGQLPSAPDGLGEDTYRFNLPIRFL